jgi:hypothetical protein
MHLWGIILKTRLSNKNLLSLLKDKIGKAGNMEIMKTGKAYKFKRAKSRMNLYSPIQKLS